MWRRAYIAGQAKTRQKPALGSEGAARAQRRLLGWVTDMGQHWCAATPSRQFRLWCAPDSQHPFFATLTAPSALRDQPSGNLGARLAHIAEKESRNRTAVLLLGGDGVSINAKTLDQAETALEKHPAVLAPAEDGGYVLLGLRQPKEAVFRDIPWGGKQVASITRQRLTELGWSWAELDEQWDVDTIADWNRFQQLPINRKR